MRDWGEVLLSSYCHLFSSYFDGATDCWHELWEFNGQQEPKFWFGDEVMWGDQEAIVLGLEWRPEDMPIKIAYGVVRSGWWYAVRPSDKAFLVRVAEDFLEEIPDKCPISDT